jgi:hypothetical protein
MVSIFLSAITSRRAPGAASLLSSEYGECFPRSRVAGLCNWPFTPSCNAEDRNVWGHTSTPNKPILETLHNWDQRKPFVLDRILVNIRPPLWSSSQSSWLQIQRSGFDFRRYQILWELVCLERGTLSLVSTIEELLGRISSGSGLENREYGRRDPSRWPRGTLYP